MLRLSRSLSRFETQDIKTQPQPNHYSKVDEECLGIRLPRFLALRSSFQEAAVRRERRPGLSSMLSSINDSNYIEPSRRKCAQGPTVCHYELTVCQQLVPHGQRLNQLLEGVFR